VLVIFSYLKKMAASVRSGYEAYPAYEAYLNERRYPQLTKRLTDYAACAG
jgi:hypothetical protein